MYVFAKVVLVILALIAIFEGIGAYNEAKSAFHQIYSAVWFAIFAISLGSAGIISALTREAEVMTELKAFLWRIKDKASAKEAAAESPNKAQNSSDPNPETPPQKVSSEPSASTRGCLHCGTEMSADAKSCPTCTRIMNPYTPCPKCKADISHRPSECPECGSRITWRSASDTTK